MRRVLYAVVVAVALVAAAAAPAHAATQKLFRPGKESYFAFVDKAVAAHAEPKASSRTVAQLKVRTPDKTDELVLVVARTEDKEGNGWLQVSLPVRPNGSKGWVPEEALSSLQPLDTWLKIDTTALTATLIKGGKAVFRARVGVGQPQWKTPKGDFYIRNKLVRYRSPAYGPVAFGTSARSPQATDWPAGGFIGIHGTDRPDLVPGRISHGCIRLRNADILELAARMPVGTPVTIR